MGPKPCAPSYCLSHCSNHHRNHPVMSVAPEYHLKEACNGCGAEVCNAEESSSFAWQVPVEIAGLRHSFGDKYGPTHEYEQLDVRPHTLSLRGVCCLPITQNTAFCSTL